MIQRKEIEHLGDLVKVELEDPEKYIEQVKQIINYFDKLDKVEFDSDETLRREVEAENLREDKHVPFEINLIDALKKDPNNFIRAPKMI